MKPDKKHSQLIVALDYEDPYKAFHLVEELDDWVKWYKIGPTLFTRSGNEVVNFLHRRSKNIFLDLKIHDTPRVVADTVKQYGDLGIRMASVHCLGGHDMLAAAAEGCRGSGLQLLGLTLLTSQSLNDMILRPEKLSDEEVFSTLLEAALHHRLSGVMCGASDIPIVKKKAIDGFLTIIAGIRIPGRDVYQDDQKRTTSPAQALDMGADYITIGRPITQAREPLAVVQSLFEGA